MGQIDSIIEEIGPFGRWQKLVYLAVGLVLIPSRMFITTFQVFIPESRCHVPQCDSQSPEFAAKHVNFTIPLMSGNVNCLRFQSLGNSCTLQSFNDQVETCSESVYDQSVFKNSFVREIDVGPCSKYSKDWPLGPEVPKLLVVEICFWTGVSLGSIFFSWYIF